MEGSKSETVFDSLNLNPQLFLNEVLNTVDDVVLEAFDFFYQEASTKLNSEGTSQRSQDLRKGVDCIRQRVQSVLDKQFAVWENYCLHHCFALPQGFVIPIADKSSENGLDPDAPFDPDLDAQLDSLRKKLTEVGKESDMLNQEIQALQRHSTVDAGYINEALKQYEKNSLPDLFQEIVTTASELKTKMEKLNTSMIAATEQTRTERVYNTEMDLSAINPAKGLSNVKLNLEGLHEFVTAMKTMKS